MRVEAEVAPSGGVAKLGVHMWMGLHPTAVEVEVVRGALRAAYITMVYAWERA